jgi:hypothetical protein
MTADPATLLVQALTWPGLTAGVFNLPLPASARSSPGLLFAVPLPAHARAMAAAIAPPGLAEELGGYLSGAQAYWRRPSPRPHERDAAFAQEAIFARLVHDHARRLILAQRPDWCAVGLAGLARVRALNPPESGRAALLLRQWDHYAAGLAQAAQAQAVLCLLDEAGVLAWRPGLVPAGWQGPMPGGGPLALLSWLLGRGAPTPPPW